MPFRVRRRRSEKSQVRELCDGRPLSRTGRGAVARLIGERGKPTVVQGPYLGSFISYRMIQLWTSGVGRDNQTARRVQLIYCIEQNRYRSHDGLMRASFPVFFTKNFVKHHRVLALKNYNSTLYATSVLNKVAHHRREKCVESFSSELTLPVFQTEVRSADKSRGKDHLSSRQLLALKRGMNHETGKA